MAKEFPYHFTVLMDIGPQVTEVIGDTINITSDGGLRVFFGKRLVGAVRPGDWKGCVLQPRKPVNSLT